MPLTDAFELFTQLTSTHTLKQIADGVGVNLGTVRRWKELRAVPSYYGVELCRFAGLPVDYSQLTAVEKDQFFTSVETAQYCYDKTLSVLSSLGVDTSQYTFIEPSVGDGSFYNLLPHDRRLGVDIEARLPDVIQQDYLSYTPPQGSYIVIGNPPFGLRGNLALKFISHSESFADYVCFILPQLFDSNGKGSCKSRVTGYGLVHSERVDTRFHYPNGKETDVHVVFQVWSRHHSAPEARSNLSGLVRVLSVSDGGTPSTTRNKRYHDVCDYFIQSTCFGKDKMKLVSSLDDLPQRRGYGILVDTQDTRVRDTIEAIDWGEVAYTSTNGAVNLRTDIIENAIANSLPYDVTPHSLESFMC